MMLLLWYIYKFHIFCSINHIQSRVVFHFTFKHTLVNFPSREFLLFSSAFDCEVNERSLYGQTLNPLILTEGTSLLHMYISAAPYTTVQQQIMFNLPPPHTTLLHDIIRDFEI